MLFISSINHLIYYCFQINDITFLHVGNNLFYKDMNDKNLVIFGPTICTRRNSQNSNLQKELMDYLEGLFREDTFNKSGFTFVTSTYLKYAQDMYRVHLQKNPRYEHLPMIPEREWKALIKDAKEKKLRKKGKTIPSPTR